MITVKKMGCSDYYCDFCFDEMCKGERRKEDLQHRDWQFRLNHKVLSVCQEHMDQLYHCLKNLKEKGQI